jgi:hypothetical protein
LLQYKSCFYRQISILVFLCRKGFRDNRFIHIVVFRVKNHCAYSIHSLQSSCKPIDTHTHLFKHYKTGIRVTKRFIQRIKTRLFQKKPLLQFKNAIIQYHKTDFHIEISRFTISNLKISMANI